MRRRRPWRDCNFSIRGLFAGEARRESANNGCAARLGAGECGGGDFAGGAGDGEAANAGERDPAVEAARERWDADAEGQQGDVAEGDAVAGGRERLEGGDVNAYGVAQVGP